MNLTPDEYVNQLFQEDELLLKVKEAIRTNGMPEVSVAAAYGRLLTFLARTSKAGSCARNRCAGWLQRHLPCSWAE